jgi:dienelactone hydrolase
MPATATPPQTAEDADLSVLARWFRWRDAPHALREHLNAEAMLLLDQREQRIAALTSAADWRNRKAEVRRTLDTLLGPFPERTPLNAQVTGIVRRQGYRVEKVLFESRPRFFVTGCLFVPDDLAGPAPAILNPIGHTDIGFRAPSYQTLILNLVRKGFIVFAFDPPGQGERLQYLDPATGTSRLGGSTREHSHFGRQCFLVGRSPGHYFVWDGMRAIDYLLTRTEVDPQRVGVTGISGGGTQTAYLAALDERVAAAAPTCYITNFQQLLTSIGPQDAEQNLLHGLAAGMDYADFLEVQAPRPTLVVATTRDIFSIEGARATCAEVARAYAALGAPDAFRLVEDDYGHGYTPATREAIYRFFQETLRLPGDSCDEAVEPLTVADLTVTPTGQLATSLGGETVFTLNRAEAAGLAEQRTQRRQDLGAHLSAVKAAAQRLSGYRPPTTPPAAFFVGRHDRPGYRIEKVVLTDDASGAVPGLVFVPATDGPHPALLYLDPAGKAAGAAGDGFAARQARRGWIVLTPDLSEVGELAPARGGVGFEPVLLGRSMPGIRAAEIVRAGRYLQARTDVQPGSIVAVAHGALGPALLHAALFDDAIGHVAVLDSLLAWQEVVDERDAVTDFAAVVPGALMAYDLPDLAACLAPRPLLVVNPRKALDEAVPQEYAESVWKVTRRAYAGQQASAALVLHADVAAAVAGLLEAWLPPA